MDGQIQHSDWADAAYPTEKVDDPLLAVRTHSNNQSATIMLIGMLDNFQPLPPFGNLIIDRMMIEPKVRLGLRFIKGPIISDTRFKVECKNPEIQQFVESQLRKFMARGMKIALKCLHRGYAANEVVYEKMPDGRFSFSYLNHIDYRSAKPLHNYGKVTSVQVLPESIVCEDSQEQLKAREASKAITLNYMKKLWVVHQREENSIYGRSQLLGAHIPYHELASFGGMRDGLSVWFRKNCFDGGTMYVPDGNSKLNGQMVENRYLGQRILDDKRSGGSLVLPSSFDEKGNPLWKYDPPTSGEAAETQLKWHDSLGDQIWEGLEVPPELSQGSEAGGSNNKRVIQTAFYTLCTGIATDIIHDFNDQCLKPLVYLNYNKQINAVDLYYEITDITVINEMDHANLQNQMGAADEKKENNNPFNNGEQGPDVEGDEPGNPKLFPATQGKFPNKRKA